MKGYKLFIIWRSLVIFNSFKLFYACPDPCNCNVTTNIIDCSNRGLSSIPEFRTVALSKIELLDLSGNNLTVFNSSNFNNILGFSVETIDVSRNRIERIVGEFSDGSEAIGYRTFNLSNNALTIFPRNIVPNRHLKGELIIDISNNFLEQLPANMFADADSFYPGFQFIVRANRIRSIHPNAFSGTIIVDAILDFRNNNLESIPETLKLPEGVRSIKMAGNPWKCDCSFRWISGTIFQNYSKTSPPICNTPSGVSGRPLFALKKSEFACAPELNDSVAILKSEGGNHILVCPVVSDPPNAEITWKLVLQDGTNEPFCIEVQSPSLTLNNLKATNILYHCTASNPAGKVTVDLRVDVTYDEISVTTEAMEDHITKNTVTVTSETLSIDNFGFTFFTEVYEDIFTSPSETEETEISTSSFKRFTTSSNFHPNERDSEICISHSSFVAFLICVSFAAVLLIIIVIGSAIFCFCFTSSKKRMQKMDFKKATETSEFTFHGPGVYAEEEEEMAQGAFQFIESSTAL